MLLIHFWNFEVLLMINDVLEKEMDNMLCYDIWTHEVTTHFSILLKKMMNWTYCIIYLFPECV